jgi:hypothetical protein
MTTQSARTGTGTMDVPSVEAELSYLGPTPQPVVVHVYALASGRPTIRPAAEKRRVAIGDARRLTNPPTLDAEGFACATEPARFADFYRDDAVRRDYYPEVARILRQHTGALEVFVFDHNVRSAVRAARGEPGVRVPVDQIHNDYTEASGPRRRLDILGAAGREDLADRRVAFVNLWRPIVGPVQDNPLALCDARSVAPEDFVSTRIHHYADDDLEQPRHVGEIYSVKYRPEHRWFYYSDLRPDECLFLKCFDSRVDGRARFMPHTGFTNPACPATFIPRESIEARTLVVFDEPY